MARVYKIEQQQIVRRPLGDVFTFFSNPKNLELLTPDFLGFKIETPSPINMQAGTIIDYTIVFWKVRMGWRTLIEKFEPGKMFVDVQLKGPYKSWRHLHRFVETPEGTEILDTVEYEMPLGLLGRFARGVFVERSLQQIFDYRLETIERLFGGGEN